MADINIEKKNKKQAWPWILGIFLVLALVSWIVWDNVLDPDVAEVAASDEYFNNDRPEVDMDADAAAVLVPAQVTTFVNFVNTEEAKGKMGLDHEYTSKGIQYLAEALNEVGDRAQLDEATIQQHREVMLDRARKIQKDPMSLHHANSIRDAFIAAANWMEAIEDKGYAAADDQIAKVRQAAEAINPQEQTLDQKNKVKTFFQKAEDALQVMMMAQE